MNKKHLVSQQSAFIPDTGMNMEHLISIPVSRVRDRINLLIPKHCIGCTVNHLSQSQHTVCLLMSWDEQVGCFLGMLV